MELISRENAIELLEALRREFQDEKLSMRAGVVEHVIHIISGMKPIAADDVKGVKSSLRLTKVEPWWKGALTGHDVTRCGMCAAKVNRADRYCPNCGRKLVG